MNSLALTSLLPYEVCLKVKCQPPKVRHSPIKDPRVTLRLLIIERVTIQGGEFVLVRAPHRRVAMLPVDILAGLLQLVVLKNAYLDAPGASTTDGQVVAYQSCQVLTVLRRSVLVMVQVQVDLVLVDCGVHLQHPGFCCSLKCVIVYFFRLG